MPDTKISDLPSASGLSGTELVAVVQSGTKKSTVAAIQAAALMRGNHTGTQTAATISDFTEVAQDAVGAALADTATLDLTYLDGSNSISGAVLDSPKVGGIAVTGTPSTGQIPTATSSSAATWQTPTAAIPTSYLDTDGTLAGNSDSKIATQKATKTYADQLIAAADAMVFKGVIDCSANPNYPAADRGWTYRVSVAGKIGGASGVNVEAGDLLLCLTDGTASGTQAGVGANWTIAQANIDGAVTGPASSTDGGLALYNGTSGKIIKADGLTPSNDDVLQRKAGAWTNRTMAQLSADLTKVHRRSYTWTVSGAIAVPSGDTDFINPMFIGLASGETAKLAACKYIVNSGTSVTAKLQINGSDATGFTAISVTTTAASTDPTDIVLSGGDKLALIVTAVSGSPKNLTFTIFVEYTA